MSTKSPVSVFIADDHALIRPGLEGSLAYASNLQLMGQARNGLEAVNLALKQTLDVVDLEISS